MITEKGLLAAQEAKRTFAYPWVLSFLIGLANLTRLPEAFIIFFFQTTSYFLTSAWVAKQLLWHSRKLSAFVYLALCSNVFIMPYLGITLTDAIYTSLVLGATAILSRAQYYPKEQGKNTFSHYFTPLILFTTALVIRPASVWLSLPIAVWILFSSFERKHLNKLTFATLVASIPLLIQITINTLAFKTVTFFPASNLGSAQLVWGIENIKYATWLGNGAPQNNYFSKNLVNIVGAGDPIKWYISHPFQGIKLIFVKLFAAFDWDYLMPYPRKIPKFKWIPSIISFSVLFWGLTGVLLNAFKNCLPVLGLRYMPLLIFASWSAVTLSSALELRFTLPMIGYFIISGTAAIHYLSQPDHRATLKYYMGGWILFMAFAVWMARFVRSQAVVQW
ncbi:MAG: hypothetical protein ACK5O7_02045 [Holosporales bacterium]